MGEPGARDLSLLAPEVRENPYPYYAALRRESPIHQLAEGMPLYAITRYADVRQVQSAGDRGVSRELQLPGGNVDQSGAVEVHGEERHRL